MTAGTDLTGVRFLTDRDAVTNGLLAAGADLAGLLRALPPGAGELPVPGSGWTVGTTAAHVVTVVRRSLGDRRRSTSGQDTAQLNATCLEELEERDPAGLADLLDAEVPTVVRSVMPRMPDDDRPVPFHGGTVVRLLTAYGIMLMELVVHRWDVARAAGPAVDLPTDVCVPAAQAMLELLPAWVDQGSSDDVALTLDVGGAGVYRLRLSAGRLDVARVRDPSQPVVRVMACELLLALCGRVVPADASFARLCAAIEPL